MEYHRNNENLGMDGNFTNCFLNARGKYVLLLGSDDIPVTGFTGMLLQFLKEGDFGLVHLKSVKQNGYILTEYHDCNEFLSAVNYWITFISANVVNAHFINDIDWNAFHGTMITQVPLYLEASCKSDKNAILSGSFYEEENDSKNNGGYNLFHVFVENLFDIFDSYVKKGLMSKKTLARIKEIEYREFLTGFIVECLIQKRNKHFEVKDSWAILWKHYGHSLYAYSSLVNYMVKSFMRKVG